MPPIVGVPAFRVWWAGPSTRICWPIRQRMSQRSSIGVPKPATRIETAPADRRGITGPPPRGASARQLLGDDVAVVELDRAVRRSPGSSRGPCRRRRRRRPRRADSSAAAIAWRRSGSTTSRAVAVAARADLLDDRERVLAAGVVGGEHRDVGEARGDRAHHGPLLAVAVAPAAEDHDHPSAFASSASARAARRTCLEAGGGVRVVDHDRRHRADWAPPPAGPEGGSAADSPAAMVAGGHPERPGGRRCGERVADVDLAAGAEPDRLARRGGSGSPRGRPRALRPRRARRASSGWRRSRAAFGRRRRRR